MKRRIMGFIVTISCIVIGGTLMILPFIRSGFGIFQSVHLIWGFIGLLILVVGIVLGFKLDITKTSALRELWDAEAERIENLENLKK